VKSISIKPTLFDFIVLFIFLLLPVTFSYFLYTNHYFIGTSFVEIYQNNNLLCKEPISKNQELKFHNFTVEIKDNKVRMKESHCPYKICVHTGWISKPYQQIVCVPNRVLIKITSEEKRFNKIDSVTY